MKNLSLDEMNQLAAKHGFKDVPLVLSNTSSAHSKVYGWYHRTDETAFILLPMEDGEFNYDLVQRSLYGSQP